MPYLLAQLGGKAMTARWDLLAAFVAGIAIALFIVTAYPAVLGLEPSTVISSALTR
jgi:hypothetical protein